MIWPFHRHKAKERIAEAQDAVTKARQELLEVKQRTPEVQAVSGSLRRVRETNHFAEHLRIIMEGGKNA